jgi:phage terminase large subunit-like protein
MWERPHDVESWRAFWALPPGHADYDEDTWTKWHEWRCEVLEKRYGLGIHYDPQMADFHLGFYRALKHTKGEWQGLSFEPLPWQEHQVLRPVFGYMRGNGLRLYRRAFVFVPKKQGKSELAAGTVLDQLFAEDEPGAEVYGAAKDYDQASGVFDVVHGMIKQSQYLKDRCKVLESTRRVIVPSSEGSNSRYHVLSAELGSKEGPSIQALVIDEVHVVPDKMIDVLTDGSGAARRQPLFLFITTAGENVLSRAYELFEYAQGVEDGEVPDEAFLPVLYFVRIDEGENWEDEEVWRRVNPSMGHTTTFEEFKAAFLEAKFMPSKRASFMRRRLNIFVADDASRYIPMEQWDACGPKVSVNDLSVAIAARQKLIEEVISTKAQGVGWMDLSSMTDITTFGLLFSLPDRRTIVIPFFFLPRENLAKRSERDRARYVQWAEAGLITLTDGSSTDYRAVRQCINKAREDGFKFREVAYDDWNAGKLEVELAEEDGFTMTPIPQNMSRMSSPTKHLLGLVLDKLIDHGGNPVLRWMADNMNVKVDQNERVQPVKNRSRGRIDGVVGIIMALERVMFEEPEKHSVYEERGVFSLEL